MGQDDHTPKSLIDLLDALDPGNPEAGSEDVQAQTRDGLSIRNMLNRAGPRSFGAALLIPALILVSPLSIIPLMPTLGGLLILTIAAQSFFGRRHIWLPRFLANRRFSAAQLTRAVTALRKPAKWLDGHSRDRIRFLTVAPFDRLALLAAIIVAATWPFLELIPMFTSVSAGGVALVAFALMAHDGIVLICGYAVLAGSLAFVTALISGFV